MPFSRPPQSQLTLFIFKFGTFPQDQSSGGHLLWGEQSRILSPPVVNSLYLPTTFSQTRPFLARQAITYVMFGISLLRKNIHVLC